MTQRAYYTDAYTTRFQTQVTAVTTFQERPALLLDSTYFYPTSGGQPHDTGTINDAPVVDVVAEGETIYHVLDEAAAPPAPGPAACAIDWPRRFDHMQQHSGQHLLSQVFYRECGLETVSVHFGAEESTLDLEGEVTPEQIARVERMAGDLVYAALPIHAYFVEEGELARVPLRRPPKVSGSIRIVEIEEFDYAACGGTHVRTTAELGPVKVVRQERRRGGSRVTFLCGRRAVDDYARKHDLLQAAAGIYSTDIQQVPELAAKGLEQVKTLQRQVDELSAQLLAYEAEELAAQATLLGSRRLVQQVWPARPVDALKTLANQLQAAPNTIALLATTSNGKATLVFARSDDIDAHMGDLLRSTLQAFGGGGGGRPEFAQGGGVDAEQALALLDHARRMLET